MDETFYRQLADMLSRGPLVVATVVRTQGSVPRQAGAKLAVGSDGTLLGTIGGGAAEAEVIARAQTLLQAAVPVGDGESSAEHFGKTESWPAGMPVSLDLNSPPLGVCGGRMHIWLQRWQGSLAQTLAAQILQALTQGPRAWLITPLDPQGFPYLSLSDSNVEHFAPLPSRPQLLAGSWVEPLLPSPTLLIVGAGHCGLSLAQEGIPETAFSRLFAPIDLEIHAETPAEIAISITAQLIQVRRGSPKRMPGET